MAGPGDDDLGEETKIRTRDEVAAKLREYGIEPPKFAEERVPPKRMASPAPAQIDPSAAAASLLAEVELEELIPPESVDGWRLTRELRRGGMARVFLVARGGDEAVLKMFAPAKEHSSFMARFDQEIAALSALDHRHVIGVLGHGEHEGRPYVLLEYAEGGDLTAITGEPVPLERALRWVAQVCRGLGAAHALGLVHRDIKPANVLLGREGEVKLGDFGLVKGSSEIRELTLTRSRELLGTPGYMAPEQLWPERRSEIGPRTDVYAAGVLLGELVSGERPSVQKQDHARVLPSLPSQVEGIAAKATADDPASRFATADAMADALELVLHKL